jgi:drug/metabolite transporter (DMT)-like permease
VLTIFLAWIFLGEQLSGLQYIGAALLVLAPLFTVYKIDLKNEKHLVVGVLWALGVVLGVSLGALYEKTILNSIDIGLYFIIGWTSQGIWSFLFNAKQLNILRDFFADKQALRDFTPVTIAASIKAPLFIGMLALVEASVVLPVSRLQTITIVIAAYIFIGEREHFWPKAFAAVLGVTGLILMTL